MSVSSTTRTSFSIIYWQSITWLLFIARRWRRARRVSTATWLWRLKYLQCVHLYLGLLHTCWSQTIFSFLFLLFFSVSRFCRERNFNVFAILFLPKFRLFQSVSFPHLICATSTSMLDAMSKRDLLFFWEKEKEKRDVILFVTATESSLTDEFVYIVTRFHCLSAFSWKFAAIFRIPLEINLWSVEDSTRWNIVEGKTKIVHVLESTWHKTMTFRCGSLVET